jgi:hypothetical protein
MKGLSSSRKKHCPCPWSSHPEYCQSEHSSRQGSGWNESDTRFKQKPTDESGNVYQLRQVHNREDKKKKKETAWFTRTVSLKEDDIGWKTKLWTYLFLRYVTLATNLTHMSLPQNGISSWSVSHGVETTHVGEYEIANNKYAISKVVFVYLKFLVIWEERLNWINTVMGLRTTL